MAFHRNVPIHDAIPKPINDDPSNTSILSDLSALLLYSGGIALASVEKQLRTMFPARYPTQVQYQMGQEDEGAKIHVKYNQYNHNHHDGNDNGIGNGKEEDENLFPSVFVCGAGQGGLAVSAVLRAHDVDYVLVEKEDSVGSAWRKRYQRLHLHTTRDSSGLPYLPFPKNCPKFPSREDVIRYLEAYCLYMKCAPRFRHKVISAVFDDKQKRWTVVVQRRKQSSDHDAAADGNSLETVTYYPKVFISCCGMDSQDYPNIPSVPNMDNFTGDLLHSVSYYSAEKWRGKRVLIVGFGNTGMELAVDCWERDCDTELCVRGLQAWLSRDGADIQMDLMGMTSIGRNLPYWIYDRVFALGAKRYSGGMKKHGFKLYTNNLFTDVKKYVRVGVMDVGFKSLVEKKQVKVRHAGLQKFSETKSKEVFFDDGSKGEYDAVVFATGYKTVIPDFFEPETAKKLVNKRTGRVITGKGEQKHVPQLYVLGFMDGWGHFLEENFEAFDCVKDIISRGYARPSLPPPPPKAKL